MEDEKKSFWNTLPGVLTGLAALVTAVGGIIIAVLAHGDKPASVSDTNTQSHRPGMVRALNRIQATLEQRHPVQKMPLGTVKIGDIVGTWNFTWHGTLPDKTVTGTMTLMQEGADRVKGKMEVSGPVPLPGSGDVSGVFTPPVLTISREISPLPLMQNFRLTVYSGTNISGTFSNDDKGIAGYRNSGSLELSR